MYDDKICVFNVERLFLISMDMYVSEFVSVWLNFKLLLFQTTVGLESFNVLESIKSEEERSRAGVAKHPVKLEVDEIARYDDDDDDDDLL